MSHVFYIKQGDTGPSVEATLKYDNGLPIDLTQAIAVLFKMGSTVDAAAAIVSATDGTVRYDWSAGETDTIGQFDAEFEIEWAGSRKQTVPSKGFIRVIISADLDE